MPTILKTLCEMLLHIHSNPYEITCLSRRLGGLNMSKVTFLMIRAKIGMVMALSAVTR